MSATLLILLIFIQVIIFGGLIYILRRVFSCNVISATKHLEELSKDFNQRQEDLKKRSEETERIYQEKLITGQDEANKIKAQIIKEAQEEKDRIIQQARKQNEEIMQQAENAAQILTQELDERIEKEAVLKASGLIQYSLPISIQKELHSQLVSDLIEAGFNKLENIAIPEGLSEVKIISAFSLSDDELNTMSDRLKKRLGSRINIKAEVDRGLVAGAAISAGSVVIDGSLRYSIQEAAKRHLSERKNQTDSKRVEE